MIQETVSGQVAPLQDGTACLETVLYAFVMEGRSEELHVLSRHFAQQQVGQAARAEAQPLVGEKFLALTSGICRLAKKTRISI